MTGYHGVVSSDPARDLPDVLELPLRSGAPWWYWLGGRPALDLVNTRRERWNRDVETLVTPGDLSAWLVQAGVAARPLRATREMLEEAYALREAIDVCVRAAVEDRPAPRAAITLVDDWLVHAGGRPQLVRGDGGAAGPDRARGGRLAARMLGTIALDAATMLGTPAERDRIRVCASETCSARFYDRSPGGPARVVLDARVRQHRQGPPPPRAGARVSGPSYRWVVLAVGCVGTAVVGILRQGCRRSARRSATSSRCRSARSAWSSAPWASG
jgi:predicted RNA-binding Zn ribbon-like protein